MKKEILVFIFLTGTLVCKAQVWKTNLNEALKEASISGKNVLLFFSASEDCSRCVDLDKTVLQSKEFGDYAKENYILARQDFRLGEDKNKEENLLIVEKYNKDGFFPLVVILNKNAKIVGQIGAYNNETPLQYIARLQSIK